MAKVRAITRGYVGLIIREAGDVFDWPEGVPVGSWVKPVAFGGKGDHDGDGLTGGSLPSEPAGDDDVDTKGKGKRGRKGKVETVQTETAEPFADPPPVRVENEINAALGTTAPDWLPPSNDAPVQADD